MRRIPVDSTRVTFIGTGKVAERAEYVELADGQRRRSGNQAREIRPDGSAGLPLWVVDVLVDDDEADRAEVVSVRVAAHEAPVTGKWQPVRFAGLVATPYVDRGSGRVAYSFAADGIEGGATAGKPERVAS